VDRRALERHRGPLGFPIPQYLAGRPALLNRGLVVVVQLKEPFPLQGIEHASCEYLADVSLVYERTIVTSTLNDRLKISRRTSSLTSICLRMVYPGATGLTRSLKSVLVERTERVVYSGDANIAADIGLYFGGS